MTHTERAREWRRKNPDKVKATKAKMFERVYREAGLIKCACGCKQDMKAMDKYGRPQRFINGHNTRKYDDPTQYKREWNHRNRLRRQEVKMKRHRSLKVKLINICGGQCKECRVQYNGKNGAIFCWHHRKPITKEFSVAQKLTVLAWSTILKEIEKCDMLCFNCHVVKHSKEI